MENDKVYKVTHMRHDTEDIDGFKFIGVFSTLEKAESAVKSLQNKPGFSEYKDDFDIGSVSIDSIGWDDGFISGFDAITDD